MVKITFVEHDGTETEVEAQLDQSLMKAATYGNVPGISADCGGNCACGTCRIYVPKEWDKAFSAPSEAELEMINYWNDRSEGVRLACQTKVHEGMEGMILNLPESQHY
ncbi:MAG: 2Fe-2S iron-sulfur cluster binding domain-containing protein [Novosphingobium sp.]|nr:2Fe-2S iron-sulfur cluster binding domain-containing protein [Novosphingobium sp.]